MHISWRLSRSISDLSIIGANRLRLKIEEKKIESLSGVCANDHEVYDWNAEEPLEYID